VVGEKGGGSTLGPAKKRGDLGNGNQRLLKGTRGIATNTGKKTHAAKGAKYLRRECGGSRKSGKKQKKKPPKANPRVEQ